MRWLPRKRHLRWYFWASLLPIPVLAGVFVWSLSNGTYFVRETYKRDVLADLEMGLVSGYLYWIHVSVVRKDETFPPTDSSFFMINWPDRSLAPPTMKWCPYLRYPNSGGIPLYLLALPFVIFSTISFFRAPLKHGEGQCQHCGYDMRGINDEKCPECGEA